MNQEQMTEKLMDNTKDIAALQEGLRSTNARVDKMYEMHGSVQDIGKNQATANARIEHLIITVENHMQNMNKGMEDIKRSQIMQGERLGELEKKGTKKLESIIGAIITVIITAVVMYFVNI